MNSVFAWASLSSLAVLSMATGGCGGATAPLTGDGGTTSGGSTSSGGAASGSGGGSTSSGGVSSSGGSSSGTGSSSSSGGVGSSGGSSSGVSSSSGGSSSGVSSSTGSSSGGEGSSSSSSGSSSGSEGGYGDLNFEQCTGPSALCDTAAQFQFYGTFTEGSGTQGCSSITAGACSFYSCSNQNAPIGLTAGTLAISGGSIPAGVTMTPDASQSDAYSYYFAGELFTAGQLLTVSSTGGQVPVFGPISVVAPAFTTLLEPTVASGGQYTIPTSQDLTLTWTGGVSPAEMLVEGVGADGGASSYFLCQWEATTGTGTVPAEILAGLAGQSNGFFVYGQVTANTLYVGAYTINLSALQYSGANADFQ